MAPLDNRQHTTSTQLYAKPDYFSKYPRASSADEDLYHAEIANSSDSVPDTPSIMSGSIDHLLSGRWIENSRARACYGNVKLGFKMGGIVGGIFGALAGTVYALQGRQFLLLPASALICKCSLPIVLYLGGGSFGFFLGCGMIIRC